MLHALVHALAAALPDLSERPDHVGIQFGSAALTAVRTPQAVMKLHMMSDKGLKTEGAVCIDGSDAGFYFAPASGSSKKNSWQIYFEGGGWCYDPIDCWGRSQTDLGSSDKWPSEASGGGLLSDDCDVNPDFCNFNRVYLKYCDGNSFSGDAAAPLVVTGLDGEKKSLYFRGHRILDAVLDTLTRDYSLGDAEQVLLTGCSAGGLATFLHTDYVHSRLKAVATGLTKYAAAPISGFFLDHLTADGQPVYETQMKEIFRLSNATNGVNAECIAAFPPEQHWTCNFAAQAYKHTSSRTFPLNSALDSWQTGCIFTAQLKPDFPQQNDTANGICRTSPDWLVDCAGDPETCDADGIALMNNYIDDFEATLRSARGVYDKAGNGFFAHSCHTHCEAQDDKAWTTFTVNGLTMQQAFSKWWRSSGDEPSAAHSYEACRYNEDSTPRKCNPTC